MTQKRMAPLKSLGSDGFGVCFYQKYWQTVGSEICKAMLSILNGDGMISSLNYTCIALIPKVNSPKFLNDFRLISLCNLILVSKVESLCKPEYLHSRTLDYGQHTSCIWVTAYYEDQQQK